MDPCYSLPNIKVIWLYMVSAPLPLQWGEGRRNLIWKFDKIFWSQLFFFYICGKINLWAELKINGGVKFVTTLLHFHSLISLETASTQKSEVFLLRISLGNLNASVVTCWYPQLYNFSFRKEFPEHFRNSLTTSSTTPFVKNSPTSCVSFL